MLHCSPINQQLLMSLQDRNFSLEALHVHSSLLPYPSETSSDSPPRSNSTSMELLGRSHIPAVSLDLSQLSLPFKLNLFSDLTLRMVLCRTFPMV
jgi:hypothetical protein